MTQQIYKEIKDGTADVSLWPTGEKDVLDPQQRDEDERGSHCLHVGCGLSAVGLPQLGDQHSDDVQEKEEVNLDRVGDRDRDRNLLILQTYLIRSDFMLSKDLQ